MAPPGQLAAADRVHVVAHADVDGLAAAAILVRWARSEGKEASWDVVGVRGLYRVLVARMREALGAPARTAVVVADVAPRAGDAYVYASLVRPGRVDLVWVDHHEWPEAARRALSSAGALLVLDAGDVAAALACRLVGCWGDPASARLVELARHDDGCRRDPEGLAERWRVVLRSLPPDALGRVVGDLARGDLWPRWADELYRGRREAYEREVASTRVEVYEHEGVRVAVATPPPSVSPCDLDLAGVLPGPGEADVVVVLYPRSVSIRTWGDVSADCVARRMGGGGHRGAAGAPRDPGLGPAQVARMVARLAAECRGARA